jgi:hypothetical protein
MKELKFAAVAIAILSTTAGAALAAGPAATAEAAPNKAAQILPAASAQRVLGGEVTADGENLLADTKNGPTAYVSKCSYELKGTNKFPPRVSLLIHHAGSKDEAKNIFDSSKATFKGVDVNSLGSPAYRTTMPAQLNILKGANWLIIQAGTVKSPDTTGQEKIARDILPKIVD